MKQMCAILVLALSSVAMAQDADHMTPEADKAYQKYLWDKHEAEKACEETVNKAKKECVDKLNKELNKLTIKDLDTATKIKSKIEELETKK